MPEMIRRLPRHAALYAGACSLMLLGGCASLPSSGPTAHDIVKRSRSEDGLRFGIVMLTPQAVDQLDKAEAARMASLTTLSSLAHEDRTDTIGPGDILEISIYEVGVSLFGSMAAGTNGQAGFDPSAHGQRFPAIAVGADGELTLPYIGRIKVAGHSPSEVEAMIDQALASQSQKPQALVAISKNIANTVYVTGDVYRPDRIPLSNNRERVLDAVALAGGPRASEEDTLVRFGRGENSVEQRLSAIRFGSPDDLVLNSGDRVELIKRPRSFTVFGATGKVSQVPFETGDVSLAEALARVGGPNDATADPRAVFLFRYDGELGDGAGQTPVIYRLNMLDPNSYFLAQRFKMRDKDVLYIANSAANQPSKLISIINQLFSPFVTARAVSR